MKKKKVSKLQKFIEDFGGRDHLAEALGYTTAAVRVWQKGLGAPRGRTIQKIIKLSKGRLSFNDIISHSTRNI